MLLSMESVILTNKTNETMYCKNCGREQQGSERFCAQCGTPYESVQQANAPVIPNIPNIPMSGSAPVPPPIPQVSPVAPAISGGVQAEHRCPNCGANYTNTTNCEYCGSLLVRFVEKGIDLSNTSYLSDEKTIPGLATELRKNLQLQKTTDDVVVTDVYSEFTDDEDHDSYFELSVMRTGYGYYEGSETPIVINDNKSGLTIVYRVIETLNPEDEWCYSKGDVEIDKAIWDYFKSLPSFPLFTQHIEMWDSNDDETGKNIRHRNHHYAIDFGEDAEGAARLISEILSIDDIVLKKIEGNKFKEEKEDYFFVTNIGSKNINDSRDSFEGPVFDWKVEEPKIHEEVQAIMSNVNNQGIQGNMAVNDDTEDDDEENNWWYWVIGLAALYFLYNLYKFLN